MHKLFAQISLAVLLGLSFTNLATAGDEIIIDNKEATFKGNWQLSKGSNQKFKDDYKFSSSTDSAEPNSTAEFRPNITSSGLYDVDIWFAQGDNRSTVAPVIVSCKSGTTVFKVDEKKNGGKWVNVAKAQEFDLGTSGVIIIGNNSGATGAVVVADAIRLVQVDGGEGGFSLTLSPAVGGTLTKEPNKSAFSSGSFVQVTAVADSGYVFNGWTGDASGMANPVTLTMDRNRSIGATFVQGGIGVIMESDEADFKGDWTLGNKQWGKPHSDVYRWISGGKDTPKKSTATYTPDIPRSGLYDIYVWYVPGGNRSQTAPFEISSKSGKRVVKIDQQKSGNDWVLLAPGVEFAKGKDGYVRLTNYEMDENSAVVVADAVAFVYVGGAGSAQTAQR